MGHPMLARLGAAGFRVGAFDIDLSARQKVAGHVGVDVVPTLVGVADGTRAVILSLPDSEIVRRVAVDGGLLQAMGSSSLLIDMSSSDPTDTRALAAQAAEHGVRLIDAPVSGGVSRARTGTLTIMVGGASDDLTDCRALLNVLGEHVMHVGDVGAGHAVKALNNLLSATSLLASVEVLATVQDFGVNPEVALDVFNRSTGRSWSTELKLPRYVLSDSFDSGFELRLMLKDMRIATTLARSIGKPALLGEAAAGYWAEAAEALADNADHTEIAKWVMQRRKGGSKDR
jgi:3-hydroxyisobutyrate dehydrogenase